MPKRSILIKIDEKMQFIKLLIISINYIYIKNWYNNCKIDNIIEFYASFHFISLIFNIT
jgi:hypothetical protein